MSSLLRRLWAAGSLQSAQTAQSSDPLTIYAAQSPMGVQLAFSRRAAVEGLTGNILATSDGLLGEPIVAEIRLPASEARLWLELTFGTSAADALLDD